MTLFRGRPADNLAGKRSVGAKGLASNLCVLSERVAPLFRKAC